PLFCPSSPLRRTPPSTLFPYTTLFRSSRAGAILILGVSLVNPLFENISFVLIWQSGATTKYQYEDNSIGVKRSPIPSAQAVRPRDRKSTRLNSSHVKISYAVFCLKKKK